MTSQDEASAQQTLEQSGFTVDVQEQDTIDPNQDGIVLDQDPVGGTKAKPGTTVTITVGRLHGRDSLMARVRVAVVMGGRSSEHEISIASARSVVESLDPARYEAVTVEIARDGRWQLGSGAQAALEQDGRSAAETLPVPTSRVPETLAGVDVVFPVLHGPFGEDGTVQGLLELADVPYVGAGVTASALCMDKDLFKSVLRDNGVPVTRSVTLRRDRTSRTRSASRSSSSRRGSGRRSGSRRRAPRRSSARGSSSPSSTTRRCSSRSSSTGSRSSAACSATRSRSRRSRARSWRNADWYDYSAKYDEGGMDLVIPPRIPQEAIERVQELSVEAFRVTDCEGMARADCFVRADGEVLVNELNTIPGFTATSVYAKLFEASGIPYAELLERLVQLAIERHERRAKL